MTAGKPVHTDTSAANVISTAKGIHHAAYRCRDAEQTRWFYEDVLGLPLAMTLVEEIVPGLSKSVPFMHLFFELGNGEYIAFFDQPDTAQPEQFQKTDSFDRHIAFEVTDESALREIQTRINAKGVSCLGPVDHDFVKSVYMYDPNGLQVEFTTRTTRHEATMIEGRANAHHAINEWCKRTRQVKESKFGVEAINRRSRQKNQPKSA